MVKVAFYSVVMMAIGCQLAVADISSDAGNLQTCHTEDYIRCALVIAGCTASCGSNYNCLVDCVINKHQQDCVDCIRSHQNQEIEDVKVQSGRCGTISYCPNRCCSTYYPSTGKWSYRCC